MDRDTPVELWSEVLRLVTHPKAVRLILTFTSGERYLVDNLEHFVVGRYVFTVFLDEGSTLLFQVSTVSCADVLLEE